MNVLKTKVIRIVFLKVFSYNNYAACSENVCHLYLHIPNQIDCFQQLNVGFHYCSFAVKSTVI